MIVYLPQLKFVTELGLFLVMGFASNLLSRAQLTLLLRGKIRIFFAVSSANVCVCVCILCWRFVALGVLIAIDFRVAQVYTAQ